MKLLMSVPTYSETLAMTTVYSIVVVQDVVRRRGGDFYFDHCAGTMISDVRNVIAGRFLESGADLLLMIDADQGVSGAMIERMLDLDKPFVGCIYPSRSFYWEQADMAKAPNLEALRYQAMRFVGYLEEDEQGLANIVNGFGKAAYVGTGVTLVNRSVFERLMEHYPELEGRGFNRSFAPYVSTNWGFFNFMDRGDGMFLSEDRSFCRRWREAGGEIWADVTSDVSHIGRYDFIGNYVDFLKANQSG